MSTTKKAASRRSIRDEMREHAHRAFHPPPEAPPPPKDALYLGRHPVTREYVYIRASDLDTHVEFVGGSRKGKTNALRRLFKELLRRKKEHGEGISVIDPHGGLAQYALELCAADPSVADDVVYVSLKDVEHVISINPLRSTGGDPYFQAACVREGLIKIFDEAQSKDKKLVSRVLTNLAQALIELNLTLLESPHFLNRSDQDEAVLASQIELLRSAALRSYWGGLLRKTGHDIEFHTMGPANRLDDLIRPPVLRRMLGQNSVSLDFLEIMNRGGIAIFDTSIGKGTEITADGQALLNALLVQQYRQAFPRRIEKGDRNYDPKQTPPHTLILDEFGSYVSTEFARTLTEASKFGLRCVFSHQNLQQLIPADGDERLLHAVLAIPNKVVFGNLSFDEAQLLAKHLYLADLNPDEIKYQGEMVTWDPVLKWGVTSRTKTRSESYEPVRRSRSSDPGARGRSASTSTDSETGRYVTQEGTSEQDPRETETESSADGPTVAQTESETEGYFTEHKVRRTPQPPIFRTVDEQVFRAAQVMSTNKRGIAVVGTENRKPMLCLVANMDQRPATLQQVDRQLASVYSRPYHFIAMQADENIEQRAAKLLAAAPPPEGRVKVRRNKATVPRKPEPESS